MVTRTFWDSFNGSGSAGLRTPFSYVASTVMIMTRPLDRWVALTESTVPGWLRSGERNARLWSGKQKASVPRRGEELELGLVRQEEFEAQQDRNVITGRITLGKLGQERQ